MNIYKLVIYILLLNLITQQVSSKPWCAGCIAVTTVGCVGGCSVFVEPKGILKCVWECEKKASVGICSSVCVGHILPYPNH